MHTSAKFKGRAQKKLRDRCRRLGGMIYNEIGLKVEYQQEKKIIRYVVIVMRGAIRAWVNL